MTPRLSRFIEIMVHMDVSDAHRGHLTPATYQAAARSIRQIVATDFGHVPFDTFVGTVEPLQTTAENLYFERHGRLPDLAGSGSARKAAAAATRVLKQAARRTASGH